MMSTLSPLLSVAVMAAAPCGATKVDFNNAYSTITYSPEILNFQEIVPEHDDDDDFTEFDDDDVLLTRCQGHCNTDDDCQGDLRCWKRGGLEVDYSALDMPLKISGSRGDMIPRCKDKDLNAKREILNWNFCYDPWSFYRLHGEKGYASVEEHSVERCAACDTDNECWKWFKCLPAEELNHQCMGEPKENWKYCGLKATQLEKKASMNEVIPNLSLKRCEGNCREDINCEPETFCFKRDGYEPVPGCSGEGNRGMNYCSAWRENPVYQTALHSEWLDVQSGWNNKLCWGDCDNDSECEGHLKCFHRDAYEPVPGCSAGTENGGKNGKEGWDYCFDPWGAYSKKPYNSLWIFDDDVSKILPRCAGDCDFDGECGKGLECFHRSPSVDDGWTSVPGCVGIGLMDYDYCYDPRSLGPPNLGT